MTRKTYPSDVGPRLLVRFPDDGLKDRIAEAARQNRRSMNNEIVFRLAATFPGQDIQAA